MPNSLLPSPVAVGGTSDIGRGIAEAFARHTEGNANIILVGRNRAATDEITAVPCPTSPFRQTRITTKETLSRYSKVDFLILSPGILNLTRDDTEEHCRKAREGRENKDAKVLSVLSAGKVDRLHDGFAFHYPNFGSLVHSYLGRFWTPLGLDSSSVFVRVIATLANSHFNLLFDLALSVEECGEYSLNGILNTALAPDAWRTGNYDEDIGKKGYFGNDEARDKLWDHILKIIKKALEGS
ncbi:hypothetical protein BT96DRAFT_1002678 [Gymnopus androsaceus JB14]|uniref:NAD(P)-binding protein n=1 Tax=Gymnopus androsaceus JB14 TaxID=1447944 RepID=A0A6A4GX51_9AGAR|nr:hypothetical protein BT96DRAFT_1002678 [Gymnopus androsaceus JB14]